MLEKFIRKNLFLPKFVKREVITFYEKKESNYCFENKFQKKFFTPLSISHIFNKISTSWLEKSFLQTKKSVTKQVKETEEQKNNQHIELPLSFWLLLDKTNKVKKFNLLVEGNLHVNNFSKEIEFNILHQVIWAYHEHLLSKQETQSLITLIIKKNISLFGGVYKVSHYEKAITIIKNSNNNISSNNTIHILEKKKKLAEFINSCLDKELYLYLMNSKLNENDKIILEYVNLKQKVYTIYLETYSGNRRSRNANGNKSILSQVSMIEDIISREYIFANQSTIYNSLGLLLNLPDFTDIINYNSILKCYQNFAKLNNSSKKVLTSDLVNKNKEVILFNLIHYGVNLNWNIENEDRENILGLELLSNMNFIEYVIDDTNFQLNITNIHGENILHLLGSFPLSNPHIRTKLKNKIDKLNDLKKEFLFNQFNENNLTPMLKAIQEKDIEMINFLCDIGVSGIEEIKGIDKFHSSPLSFLQYQITGIDENIDIDPNMNVDFSVLKDDNVQYDELYCFYKNWSIEKNYKIMSKRLVQIKNKGKVIKI